MDKYFKWKPKQLPKLFFCDSCIEIFNYLFPNEKSLMHFFVTKYYAIKMKFTI